MKHLALLRLLLSMVYEKRRGLVEYNVVLSTGCTGDLRGRGTCKGLQRGAIPKQKLYVLSL